MTRRVPACPFCGPHPIKTREEYEGSLNGTFAREKFVNSICDRCFVAIVDSIREQGVKLTFSDDRPVNEAEQIGGVM